MSYAPVIGLEIHLELATRQKMFCRCPSNHFGQPPNSQTCPVCLGLPGALPYPNQQAIEWTALLGLALGCQIQRFSKFDRKNYFYPDLPKGYQISQYDQPIARHGKLKLPTINNQQPTIRINRVHLEEDTAKLSHQTITGQKFSLIDFNRSGVPLVEIVSEPDITSIEALESFAKKIHQLVRYLGISEANMEKGQLRLELNISLRRKGDKKLPDYRVEVKNINSFRFLKQAAKFEIKRQTKALNAGRKLIQETRGWNQKSQTTFSQRTKEEAHDYRYFPEPDIPPFTRTKAQIQNLKNQLPELPAEKKARFQKDFGLPENYAALLTRTIKKADFFEKAASLAKKMGLTPKEVANLIINQKLNLRKADPSKLVKKLAKKKASKKLGQKETEEIIKKIIRQNPDEVKKYCQGKVALLQFFIGQVMSQSRGQANPNLAKKILLKKLKQ
jgi:aspartyl-tRNA(Asn)/glutamyl-tRNA(Gln) amidotransferase subunit B